MNYDEALEWVFNVRRFGPKRTLIPTRKILDLLGRPQDSFKIIHIGGTNGKGSTSAMTASILQAEGYKVGLFTSPHLEVFKERVKVNGEMIPGDDVARLLSAIRPLFEEMLGYSESMPLRFFDIVTAMALMYFKEQRVDYAVLEVGLGGRLDATTVVDPLVSVITNIGFEHTNILGDTLEEIAHEKAGIIKEDRILVTATQDELVFNVFKETADSLNSEVVRIGYDTMYQRFGSTLTGQTFSLCSLSGEYSELYIPLLGDHQVMNAATAVAAVESLSKYGVTITEKGVKEGLRRVYWPGRLEIIKTEPLVVLDCAKDAEATEAVRETITRDFTYQRLIAVVSISSDKNIPGMMMNISMIADHVILTTHRVMGRAADPEILAAEVKKHGKPYEIIPEQEKAFTRALELAKKQDMVLVIGSVFLAGEAREFLMGH
ncbi:MAG: bifunctional folylpolyglutamate synthase/dihydrofolate synthase [Candidatus Bathyarchaeota archaeon]|nr:bifunctional folylpolyglutamate synthase/dihydrofolate synthase [Candidatus Bathyarchaeota archaeon]